MQARFRAKKVKKSRRQKEQNKDLGSTCAHPIPYPTLTKRLSIAKSLKLMQLRFSVALKISCVFICSAIGFL